MRGLLQSLCSSLVVKRPSTREKRHRHAQMNMLLAQPLSARLHTKAAPCHPHTKVVLTARPFLVTPQHHQARLGRSQGSIVCSAAVSQSEGEGVVGTSQELVELNKDTFYDALKDAGNTLVVVDFYTLWCGPCKAIYPKLLEFRDTYADVLFYKFNCNKANKDLGQQLGIKVAPTFQLYKNGNKVAEITGAKADVLRELIEQHK